MHRVCIVGLLFVASACKPPHVILSVSDSTQVATEATVVVFAPDDGKVTRVPMKGKKFPINVTLHTDRSGVRANLWVEARDRAEQPLARGRVALEFPEGSSGSAAVDLWHACERANVEGLACAHEQPTETGICVAGGCVDSECGDGYIDIANEEQCDDGNDDDSDACVRCRSATCGDTHVRSDIIDASDPDYEECEPLSMGAACTDACLLNVCGDTHLGPGEECEFVTALTAAGYADLDATNTGECVVLAGPEGFLCRAARCGDGYLWDVEDCDDGNTTGGDGCSADCGKAEACGDAVVDEGEDCDDQNDNPNDGCDACRLTSWQPLAAAGPSTAVLPPLQFPIDPDDVWVDRAGVLYVADAHSRQIVRHDPNAPASVVTVVAGGGDAGYSGDGGPARAARFDSPTSVAVDDFGNVFIADTGNMNVRMVGRDGTIDTVVESTDLPGLNDLAIAPNGDLLVARSGAFPMLRLSMVGGEPVGPATEMFPACVNCRADEVAAGGGHIYVIRDTIYEVVGGAAVRVSYSVVLGAQALTVGPGGDLYLIKSTTNHRDVYRMDPLDGSVATIAGSGQCEVADLCMDGTPALGASLGLMTSVAVSSAGELYLGERTGVIRRIDLNQATPTIERHLGTGGARLQREPIPLAMRMRVPTSIVMADDVTMLVAVHSDHLVYRIDLTRDQPAEIVAGNGIPCDTDNCVAWPTDMVLAGEHLWVAVNDGLLRVDLSASPPMIERFTSAALRPRYLALRATDNGALYFTSQLAMGIYQVDILADGLGPVQHVFGRECQAEPPMLCNIGMCGAADLETVPVAAEADTGHAHGLVADQVNGVNRVLMAIDSGVWRILVESSDACLTGPALGEDGFDQPGQISLVDGDSLLVANGSNVLLYKNLFRSQSIQTEVVAGTGIPGTSGDGGSALLAQVEDVVDVVDASDLSPFFGTLLLQKNGSIRNIDITGDISTVVGPRVPDGDGPVNLDDASMRFFGAPQGLARVHDGWVATDSKEQRLRWMGSERLATVVGMVDGAADDGTTGLAYRLLGEPVGVAYIPAWDSVLVSERSLHTLLRVDTSTTSWTVHDFAGAVGVSDSVDDLVGAARFNEPAGLAIDVARDLLYVADSGSHVIRRIALASTPGDSVVDTIAGIPNLPGYMEESIPVAALASPMATPWALAVAANGDVYVAERDNHRVRVIHIDPSDPLGPGTTIETVIGDRTPSSHGDGSPARALPVDTPSGLAIDAHGNLFVTSSDVIRVVTADANGAASGDSTVLNIYGRGVTGSALEQGTSCLSGLSFVPGAPADRLWVLDGCAGALLRLDRVP